MRNVPPELVSLVEQLPGCRLLIAPDYRIVASMSCHEAHCGALEQPQIVGRYCYEVSHGYDSPCDMHGESCPLRASMASGSRERCVHVHHTSNGLEHVEIELIPLRDGSGRVTLYMEHMESLARPNYRPDYVGSAPAFLSMLDLVKRVAPTETSVLLLGETGTGKELMARAVHESSPRAKGPFVVVDCAGLAETLFESELFGHEKGAFTGAVGRKLGLVEAAAGGTLFIDEIGDVPLSLQVKLLRLLETGLFRRVGGTEMQRAEFRLVAATHRDLTRMVTDGAFRSDLYYRLTAFPIEVPSLRDRRSDVAALAGSILARLERGRGLTISAEALALLNAYSYPGNVRELRNILERASLMADSTSIEVRHLPPHLWQPGEEHVESPHQIASQPLLAAEQGAIRRAMTQHQGVRRDLARKLSISERTLYRKLRAMREGACNFESAAEPNVEPPLRLPQNVDAGTT